MFPGSWFCALIGQGVQEYVGVLSAVFNGLFYGVILWLVFVGLSRKLEN
jgi:tetrahydromethanopterin S-methyltransferase subunit F